MIDRRLLLAGAGALALVAGLRWLRATDVEAASSFELQKSDSEWRAVLSKAQYEVLRLHRTEVPGRARSITRSARACSPAPGATFRCFLPTPNTTAVPAGRASMSAGERGRHRHRPRPAAGAYGGALPALRRTPGSRLPRWPAPHWTALLHQRGGVEVQRRCGGLSRSFRSAGTRHSGAFASSRASVRFDR